MPFNYHTKEQNKVVFTRQSAGFTRFMFIFIGFTFTLIGFSIFYFNGRSTEMPMAMMQYFIPGMGIIGIYVGIILPATIKKGTPDEIIFDNANGRIEINQKCSEINTAYIYYDEVSDFKIESKKSSSSSNNSSRTYYSYHVYLLKKDGGAWELLKRNSLENAEKEVSNLKSLIDFSNAPQKTNINHQLCSKYELISGFEKMELKWQNKIGFSAIYLICFCFVFVAAFYSVLYNTSNLPVFAYLVIGFIALIFLVVITFNFIKLFKNFNTIYTIKISKSELSYFEKSMNDMIKKEVKIPIKELHSISYSFHSQDPICKFEINSHDQLKRKIAVDFSTSSFGFKEWLNFQKDLLSFEIQSLTPVEALNLENYLNNQAINFGLKNTND